MEKRAAAEVRGDMEAAGILSPSMMLMDQPKPVDATLKLPPLPTAVAASQEPAASATAITTPTAEPPPAAPAPTEVISVTSWVPSLPNPKTKKQLVLEKLPEVACSTFRGFQGQMQSNIVLMQGFATLLKMMTINYANRDFGFKQNAVESAADIVLVCAAMPRVLEYFVELVNTMYADGFGDPVDDQASQPVCDPLPLIEVSLNPFPFFFSPTGDLGRSNHDSVRGGF